MLPANTIKHHQSQLEPYGIQWVHQAVRERPRCPSLDRGGKSKCSTVRYVVPAAVQSSWESCKSVGDVLIDHRCVPDGQSHLWSTIQYNRWILYFSVALGEWLEPPTDYESPLPAKGSLSQLEAPIILPPSTASAVCSLCMKIGACPYCTASFRSSGA